MNVSILHGDVREKLAAACTTLAYLAGVIDSDGYIGVKRNTYSMRVIGDSSQPTYSERVCIKQVEPHAVQLLKEMFGGSYSVQNASVTRGKPLHYWEVTDKKAVLFLHSILPYLRIKREQALNCLELHEIKESSKKARVSFGRGHAGGARRTLENSNAMQELYLRGKALNCVGVAPCP